jgi:chemotaxis protein MotB
MSGRKHKKHEEHISEAWLLPYSDLVTLLLAVFIVLFAVSQQDIAKAQAMASAFRSIFTGQAATEEVSIIDGGNLTPGIVDAAMQQRQIDRLRHDLDQYVAANELGEQIAITRTPDGILITLISDVLFASGSAEITQANAEIARRVGGMLALNQTPEARLRVITSGHTDNIPIFTPQFRSNWHLSVARAVNFMELLMQYSGLDPALFSARGLGEFSPIDTNDTPEGRQRNRRVELHVVPEEIILPNVPASIIVPQ